MATRVIQGFFVGGAMRAAPGVVLPMTPARALQAQTRPGAPIRPAGPPQPAFAPAARVAQPRGGNGNIEVDSAKLGLARNGGNPLPAPLLAKMEAAFGADFSAVRVHIGPQAARIGAIAFTTGNDLYFAPGQYQPNSAQGQQLIGHELAHVIQQRQGRVRAPGNGVAVVQDNALEAEADRLGMRAANYRAPPQARTGPVQRKVARASVPAIPPRNFSLSRGRTAAPAARRAVQPKVPGRIVQRMMTSTKSYSFTGNVVNNWQSSDDTGNVDLNMALASFGKPTTGIIKEYMDLGDRIGFESKGKSFSPMLEQDILSMLRSNDALNFGTNDFLSDVWSDNLSDYTGSKSGGALYGPMRSKLTTDFKGQTLNGDLVNEYLKAISGRPAEVHHILYKSIFGKHAVNINNLILVNRSASETRDGFSQHELMHYVSSGGSKDKFRVIDDKYVKLFELERKI